MEPADRPLREADDSVSGGGEAVLVLITTATREEADRIARELVGQRLAACVNIIPQVRSIFSWENNLSDEEEVLLTVKTRRSRFRQLAVSVKALHSYRVPEIIAVPILEGSANYLSWIDEVTR
jgi:periplasmic divalent cation tolerance protein